MHSPENESLDGFEEEIILRLVNCLVMDRAVRRHSRPFYKKIMDTQKFGEDSGIEGSER